MRKAILATLFFAPALAFACPNLTGNFTCQGEDGPEQVSFSQQDQGGVTHYYMNGEGPFPADGVVRNIPDSADMKNGTYRTSCSGPQVIVHITGDAYTEGNYTGHLDANLIFEIDGNNNLVDRVNGHFDMKDGGRWPISQMRVCTRN